MGRPKRSTNPYRLGETILWTTNTFDTAGRPWKVTTPDGAIVETTYALATTGSHIGTVVTVKDQAAKPRRSITNALGQLVRVDEPNNAGQLGTVASPNQPTSYSYDTLNNLTTVNQGIQTRTFSYNSLSRLLSATNPESGTISYSYDLNGNLTSKVDARSITTSYTYDALNRVTQRSYSGESGYTTPNVTYTYDDSQIANSRGKLTKVSSSISETRYTAFDILGRVLSSQQITDGQAYSSAYTYNLSGALVEQTYPSGRIVKNVLDNNGDLSLVQSRKNQNFGYHTYASSFTYNAAGSMTSMQLGNGRWESKQFNSRLQPTQIALGATQGAANLWQMQYEFGELLENGSVDITKNNSNVAKQTITTPVAGGSGGFSAVQTFTYDSLKRIATATEKIGGNQTWKQSFEYDRFGNREFDRPNTTTIPTNCLDEVCNPEIDSQNNRIDDQQGYEYDQVGNVTKNAENLRFIYDAENKIAEVRDATSNVLINQYFYDGDGTRIKAVKMSGVTTYAYDAFDKLVAEYESDPPTIQNPAVSYMTSDMLGSPRVITDANGVVTSRRDFMPFGDEITAGVGARTTEHGYSAGDGINQKFTGQLRDEEVKLDYFNARHLAFTLGRFMSADIFGGKISNPQTLNLYAYALNNPLKWVDPTGHFASDPEDCPETGCTVDENNKLKKGDEDYVLPMESVTVNGQEPQELEDSAQDYIPVWGNFRRMMWNASCVGGRGCNVGKALGYFALTAADLSGIGYGLRVAALSRPLIQETGEMFAREVIEETTEIGATIIRNNADDILEEAAKPVSSLYDDSITKSGSIRNVQTDVTPSKFVSNLEKSGFSKSVSKDGKVINLEKGSLKYSVRTKTVGSKPPSVNVFKNGRPTHKIRLKL